MPLHRGHTGQAGGAGSGEHPHEHGLDLIIGVMSGQDTAGAQPFPDRLEPAVASHPSEGLSGISTQPEPADLDGKAVRPGQPAYLIRHPGAVWMDPVIQVGNAQIQPVQVSSPHQKIQQGNRIGSTGHGDDTSPGRQRQGGEMVAKEVDQAHDHEFNAGRRAR